jgi:hypothetical protein
MLVPDVEHGQSLVDADDAAVFDTLRQRPRHPPRPGGQVENDLIAFQGQRFDQFGREIASDIRQCAPIELCGMGRIMEARLVLMTMPMIVFVPVRVAMSVIMRMPMFLIVAVRLMLMAVTMRVFVSMIVFVFGFAFVRMTVIVPAAMFMFMFFRHLIFLTF